MKTASYKALNVLIVESQNYVTSDIGSASCVPPSSVYFLKPGRTLGAVLAILIAF